MTTDTLIVFAIIALILFLIGLNLGFAAGRSWEKYIFGRDIINGKRKIRHELW